MKKNKIVIYCLIIISFIFTAISLNFISDVIPTHFGVNGKPDQYGSKYFLLLFPIIQTIIGLAMVFVSKSSKVSENYSKYLLITCIVTELIFSGLLIFYIIYSLTYEDGNSMSNISKVILPLFGILFIILGNFLPKIEKNKTLGIKTKWSLYSDVTWQKTHRFAGFFSVPMGALLIILSIFFNDEVNFLILVSLLLAFLITTTIASYIYYNQEKSKQ